MSQEIKLKSGEVFLLLPNGNNLRLSVRADGVVMMIGNGQNIEVTTLNSFPAVKLVHPLS